MSRIVSILGAESTGKTTLSVQLADALRAQGHRVALVAEYLREFCDEHGRAPRQDEQAAIAAEQTRRIDEASRTHEIVIADTSAIMIAVYSDQLFNDPNLYPAAEQAQRAHTLTLLTALDIPWVADVQRDGPHVREPVAERVRNSLARAGVAHSLVSGDGHARLESALRAARDTLA